MLPGIAVRHARTGIAALNVVTAALDVDRRTMGCDVRFETSVEGLVVAIRELERRHGRVVVGWSFYSEDFTARAAELARVREATSGAQVLHVAGGVHATAEPRETLRAGFDLCVVGEGEVTMVEIVSAVASGRDPRTLPGVASLDAEGRFMSHGPGPRRPLDDFPAFNVRFGKWNAIEITRGCVYACSFCQTPFAFKARFRHRSVANVREHVAAMRADGVRYVRFVTPTALSYGSEDTSVRLEAIDALLAAVREEIGPDGKVYFGSFPSEVRPEHVTPEALRVLRRWVDGDVLVIGGQSGSQRMLDAMRRDHTVEDVERAVRVAVAHGFLPDVDFLFGMPGETVEDREATIRFARRLVELGARIHTHAFMPLPGTPLAHAVPAPIDDELRVEIGRLEARGAAHGQWRRQIVAADALVRRASSSRNKRSARRLRKGGDELDDAG